MFVRPPRGAWRAPAGVQISTAIHSLRAAVTVFEELRTKLPRLDSITKSRGCHAFVSEPSFEQIAQAVPRRHDLCGGGPWRRGRRFARFLPLRGASRRSADQSDRRFRNKSGTGVVAAAAQARPRRFPDRAQSTSGSGEKNCDRCRNPSPGSPLIVRRRAKPPSPSPSITRCRTPAAFAVGVHLFCAGSRRAHSVGHGQIVAMDHFRAAGIAQNGRDFAGRAAPDFLRILRVIGA